MRRIVAIAALAAGCFRPPDRARVPSSTPPCSIATDDAPRSVLLVANSKAGSVTVIDEARLEPLCELDAIPDIAERSAEWGLVHRFVNWYAGYRYADDLATSPDGRILYVSRASVGDVAAFSLPDGRPLWRVPVDGHRADHLALSRDGRRLFVSAITANAVQVIDTERHKAIASIPTGARPHVLRLSDDQRTLYIGELEGNAIDVVDLPASRVRQRIGFEAGVRVFDVTRDERYLYTQLSSFHGFLEYDLRARRVTKSVFLPETATSRAYHGHYPKDAAHHGLVLSRDDRWMCIAATASDYVAVLARPSLDVAGLVPVGRQPGWTIDSTDGRACYVSLREARAVSVIDYASRREVRRIAVGDYPQRMITAILAPRSSQAP